MAGRRRGARRAPTASTASLARAPRSRAARTPTMRLASTIPARASTRGSRRSPAEAARLRDVRRGGAAAARTSAPACADGSTRRPRRTAAPTPGLARAATANRLVTCTEDDPNESTSTDCAAFGATCGDSKQAGGLLARACLSPALCPAGAPRCAATASMPSSAAATARSSARRARRARAARSTAASTARPRPSARPPVHRHCDVVGKRWCEQDRLVSCQPHGPLGEAAVTDCAASGLACDDHLEGGAACVVPGPRACDHAPTRCDGDALAFCAAGRRVRVSCRDLGFSACDPDAHGVDAACATVSSRP